METKTRFVFLMHPKEFKREKIGTGRLTHLSLSNSEIHVGVGFDADEAVQALLHDPQSFPVLLYPGADAKNLSAGEFSAADLGGRRLTILLLDATWSGARKMLKLSPSLQRLPRLMFSPTVSRFVIKQQPQAGCVSTLEAVHETLLALERSGLDAYPYPDRLINLFTRMQDFQIRCAADPTRTGYRHRPYTPVVERNPTKGQSASRRNSFFKKPIKIPASQPPFSSATPAATPPP